MSWTPIDTAPRDGSDILVRRLEDDGQVWAAVAQWWVGLWVFMYSQTSQPTLLRFEPTEWQPIDHELPEAKEEPEDATEIGEAAEGDAGSGVGQVDAGDPQEGGG
jgi:hypothetical protein